MLNLKTTVNKYDIRKFKAFEPSDEEGLQIDWIRGLLDQIEFANRPEVLSDYVLGLVVRRRKM